MHLLYCVEYMRAFHIRSDDDGVTWACSDLAVLPDGTMLCFYESGDPENPRKNGRDWASSFLRLARFNLDWLTSTNQTPKPAENGIKGKKKS